MENDYTKYSEPLQSEPEVDQNVNSEPIIGTVTNCSKLNVRSAPYIDAEVLCTIPAGAQVLLTNREPMKGFYAVCTEAGMEGFCAWRYISINREG